MYVGLIDLLYNLCAIPLMRGAAWVGPLYSHKWRVRQAELRRPRSIPSRANRSGVRVWFHAASMGEFEQLLPIVDHVREALSDVYVVCTITSPSGIDHARNSPQIDLAVLLPTDDRASMDVLVQEIDPDLVVIDRYDLWRNMICAISNARVPMVLVNATSPSAARTTIIRPWVADTYGKLHSVIAVSESEADLFRDLTPTVPVTVVADTRIDRVLDRVRVPAHAINHLRSSRPTIVIGSSWPQDEQLFEQALTPDIRSTVRLVIVPHELSTDKIQQLVDRFDAVRVSEVGQQWDGNIVVDQMGLLVELYSIATAAYVGGGFGKGVHSTTEPAIHKLSIASGPNIERSADARSLASNGVLTVVHSAADLQAWIVGNVLNKDSRSAASQRALLWTESRQGGAQMIADHLIASLTV